MAPLWHDAGDADPKSALLESGASLFRVCYSLRIPEGVSNIHIMIKFKKISLKSKKMDSFKIISAQWPKLPIYSL